MAYNRKPHLFQFQGKFGVFAFLGAHVFSAPGTFDFVDHFLAPFRDLIRKRAPFRTKEALYFNKVR
jgi:hypothetical protein